MDFAPFRALAAMPWAMTAHIVYSTVDPTAPATFSSRIIAEVIRGEIGFDGVLISDDLSMRALGGELGGRTRQALAAGCVVVGSDTEPVREFITHDDNGVLTPFFDIPRLAETILGLIEDTKCARRLREGARRYAEAKLAMADYIGAYEALLTRIRGHTAVERAAAAVIESLPVRRRARA